MYKKLKRYFISKKNNANKNKYDIRKFTCLPTRRANCLNENSLYKESRNEEPNTKIFNIFAEVHNSNEEQQQEDIDYDSTCIVSNIVSTICDEKSQQKLKMNERIDDNASALDNRGKQEFVSNVERKQNAVSQIIQLYDDLPKLRTELRILLTKNAIVYLLGTNHADPQCAIDVANIIKKVEPETVVIELCPWRACGCPIHRNNVFQRKPKFTFRYLRRVITQIGFLPAMIFFTDAFNEQSFTKDLIDYGGEFVVAGHFCECLEKCKIVLGDRDILLTIKRQASAMSSWTGLRITILVTLSLVFKKYTNRLLLRGHQLVVRDPRFYQIVVFERDIFLAYMIEIASNLKYESKVPRIVAVVGQGHLNGIQNFWGKDTSSLLPFILTRKVFF